MNAEIRNSDRYKGYEADKPFGALLIESGNVIDLGAKPEKIANDSTRIVTWTNEKGEKCLLQSQQVPTSDAENWSGKKPNTYIEYILMYGEYKYMYGSDSERIYICSNGKAKAAGPKTRAIRINDLLGKLESFDKEKALAAQYEYWIGDVNEKFQEIVDDNEEFDRKIGKTILRKTKVTPKKLRKAIPDIDDHSFARFVSDIV